ncbi:MAG: N,N-dimethylformamidase beta subunit family domain-containing protein [Nitrososphaeraceae archaeon]
MILGHQEYVTQNEYNNLKGSVSNGGILILSDGNALYTQVKYDKSTDTITLVKGNG